MFQWHLQIPIEENPKFFELFLMGGTRSNPKNWIGRVKFWIMTRPDRSSRCAICWAIRKFRSGSSGRPAGRKISRKPRHL